VIPIGVHLSSGGSSVDEIVDAAQAFEAAGFDSVWIGSHLIDYYDPSRAVPDCFVTLAAVSALTTSFTVGSLAIPAIRTHPALLAKVAGTLDEVSNGRFTLGVGAGGTRDEHLALGMSFPRRAERVERLEQALRTLIALRHGGPVDVDIDFDIDVEGITLRDAWCRPAFARTPLLVAALGPRTARLAGRLADEVNSIDYAHTYDAAAVLASARASAAAAGRTVRSSLMIPAPGEDDIGGGAHPEAGPSRAEDLGADRLIYRLLPPYPTPAQVLESAFGAG
jgi:alkanesulfonate monooxygenase SsuD/methylene tetrahydromethanopterin reductase-like flavin-dependent oxidoreductase (luciferase family)